MKLKGKGAVVTGGGRGIGAAIARALAAEGARVVVAARSLDQLEKVAAEVKGTAAAFDISDPAQCAAMADQAGPVDILVNNAGVASSAPFHRLTLEEWRRMFDINVTGAFLVTQHLLPGMLERGWGRIVNMASVAGLSGAAYITHYAASKHALMGLTRSLAVEIQGKGVTVNAVCPGYVYTDMARKAIDMVIDKKGVSEEEAREAVLKTTGQKRFVQPEEVARKVVELCVGDAHGQEIVIE